MSERKPLLAWEQSAREIESHAELAEALSSLEQEAIRDNYPFLVELTMPDGLTIAIGLGREDSVVLYSKSVGIHAHSQSGQDEGGFIVFFYKGSWSEFPDFWRVPRVKALNVMFEFYKTGIRPDVIDWKEAYG